MPKAMLKFKCNHCKQLFDQEDNATYHEEECFYNVNVKSCITCAYKSGTNEDNVKWCRIKDHQIFKRKCSIRDCDGWVDENEFDDDYNYDERCFYGEEDWA